MVEKAVRLGGLRRGAVLDRRDPALPDLWLYTKLRAAGVREVQRSPNPFPGYAYFRIRDLPPRFIAHNEMIIALVFSEYARHLGLSKFMNALKANDRTLFRVSTSPIAQLYSTLCRAGLDGRPLSAVTGVTEAGPKPYLIPLAYADYFTAYRSQSKDDYKAIFENMLPRSGSTSTGTATRIRPAPRRRSTEPRAGIRRSHEHRHRARREPVDGH